MNQEFKNYLAVSWEKVLSNEENIASLFKSLKLEHYKDVKIVSRDYSEDGRLIALIEAHNGNDTHKIIIDATSGIPTWQQFINITYDQGDSTDVKIILYGEDYQDFIFSAPAGGLYDISNLVRRNNKCAVRTYLVKGIGYDPNGQKYLNKIDIQEEPENVENDGSLHIPPKLVIQKAEFWTGYYLPYWCTEPDEQDDDFEEWQPGYSLSDDLSTKAFWNDEGFFIELRGKLNPDAITWIWTNRKQLFQEKYPGCPIELKREDNQPYAISVRIVNIPIKELIEMTPRDKWGYGDLVYGEEHKFVEVAEEAIDDYRGANKEPEASAVA